MKDWNEIINPILLVLGTNLLASIILLLILTLYPKYVMYLFYKYQCFKLDLKKKKLTLSPNFSFSYIERGSVGCQIPTVLLIHGFTGSKEQFLPVIKHLPRTFHLIAVDLFGHGETSIDKKEVCSVMNFVNYMKKFVNLLGLSERKFHIAGTSLGGHVAGMYAVTYPNDILSLSMFCPHGISFKKEYLLRELALTSELDFFPETVDAYKKFMYDWIYYKKHHIPSIFLSGLLQIRQEKYEFFKYCAEQLFEDHSLHLLEKNLNKITSPLMVVWGKEDKLLSIECLETIKQKLSYPPRSILEVSDAAHGIIIEQPRKCASFLIDLINS